MSETDGLCPGCNGVRPKPCLTEEMILNDDYMGGIKGWRRYRIEYGFECSCPEGVIYLPPDVLPEWFEEWLENFCK